MDTSNSSNQDFTKTLPLETLGRILALANKKCSHAANAPYGDSSLKIFASVDSYWRRAAFETSELWTHIDILPVGHDYEREFYYRQARVFLERSRGRPLHLHVREEEEGCDWWDIDSLLTHFLIPIAKRIVSVDFNLSFPSRRVSHTVIRDWIDRGTLGSATSLTILDTSPMDAVEIVDCNPNRYCLPSKMWRSAFFSKIRTLSLQNALLDWDSLAFKGLQELHLGRLPNAHLPTLDTLTTVLAQSPRLESLTISHLGLRRSRYAGDWSTKDDSQVPRVQLDQLRTLNLSQCPTFTTTRLLPKLVTRSRLLNVGINIGEQRLEKIYRQMLASIQSFLSDMKPSRVYFPECRDDDDFPGPFPFEPLPLVNYLDFQDCASLRASLDKPVSSREEIGNPTYVYVPLCAAASEGARIVSTFGPTILGVLHAACSHCKDKCDQYDMETLRNTLGDQVQIVEYAVGKGPGDSWPCAVRYLNIEYRSLPWWYR